jgi:hypothetical protein
VHSERRRGKSRSRILYWFRTPAGVRVGRAALDDEALRQIEELNPSIDFDWPRILKGQGDQKATGQPPQESRKDEPQQEPRHEKREEQKAEARAEQRAAERAEERADARAEARAEERAEEKDTRAETVAEPVPPDREIPAHARIGPDGVARLRSRYAEVLTRVSERVTDPVQKEELKARAERLNPDSWVTDQEVVQGLEEYESTLAGLQGVVGRKRRRRRRGRRSDATASSMAPGQAGDAGDAADDELSELNGPDDEGDAVVPSEDSSEPAPEKPEEL